MELESRVSDKIGLVFRPYTLADLMNAPTETAESGYKRGYHQGYWAALSAVYDLWFMGKQRSHNYLYNFWADDLARWRSFERDKFTLPPACIIRCVYCKKRQAENMDHIYPKSRGGSNEDDNLVPACKHCNCSKHAQTPDEWRNNQGSRQRFIK